MLRVYTEINHLWLPYQLVTSWLMFSHYIVNKYFVEDNIGICKIAFVVPPILLDGS